VLHLVNYRKIFVILSLLVIVPGAIALGLFGLNIGIDFAGGATVEFHPQKQMDPAQVQALLKPLNLQDLQIVSGNDPQQVGNKTIWVTLNTQVDSNVQNAITSAITQKYPEVQKNITFTTVPALSANDKAYTLVTMSGFANAPQVSDIKTLLANLPRTSDPTKGAPTTSATPTPVATAQATPQATAKAQSTQQAAAKATSTPAARATATATTPIVGTSNPANIAVSVKGVTPGTTTQTLTLLTRTSIKTHAENSSEVDIEKIQATLLKAGGPYIQLVSSSEVGPSVASDTTKNAILAVAAASLFILLYIWFSFRKLAKAWRYGTCAIIAMLHDVLVVLGIFAILGHFFNIQIDALFITALLTVVGFSVHDTIVVFDRIRENLHRRTVETFEEVVNASLVQTMARSLNTSLTVLLTLLALTLFTSSASASIHTFTLTLLIGIFSGTYSSIFNASMLLVMWDKGEWGFGFFNRHPERSTEKREARELVRAR
jgi:preprotein translocase SecF subunit